MLDPLEHPLVSLFGITTIILGLAFAIGVVVYFCTGCNSPYNYKYIDLNDNEGYAQWCNSGETLSCYANRGYIQVKEFHKNV